jgi:hypothetical protein
MTHCWIRVTISGKPQLVNMAKQELVYENDEGIACIDNCLPGERGGVIEVDQPVEEIFRMIRAASHPEQSRSPAVNPAE